MEDISRQRHNNVPWLTRPIWIKRDQCFPGWLCECPSHGTTGHHEATPALPAAQRAKLHLALPYIFAVNPMEMAELLRLDTWFQKFKHKPSYGLCWSPGIDIAPDMRTFVAGILGVLLPQRWPQLQPSSSPSHSHMLQTLLRLLDKRNCPFTFISVVRDWIKGCMFSLLPLSFWSNVVQMAISSQPLYLFVTFLFNFPKTNTHS